MTPLALSVLLFAPAADPPAPKAPPRAAVPWWMPHRDGDFPRMLFAILGGSRMGPGDGWFGPSQSRYDWRWVAVKHGIDPKTELPKAKFRGSATLFAALDRDGDGVLRADDFDWSDDAPFVRQTAQARQWLDRADKDEDRKLSKVEWDALFKKAADGKDHLTPDDVRALLFPPQPRSGGRPSGMPSRETLLLGLLTGEIGSPYPGPKLGAVAPDFTLTTQDGKESVTLSDFRGDKPVVLIFGSFTWGPYRAQFGSLEALKAKYGEKVEFVGVYVREAHPTDDWRMASNDKAGVAVAQPKTDAERRKVASQCCAALKMSIPLLVDTIDDAVGHAYSGMPDRLYLIDRAGRVAYKGGRGPFGFKPDELGQAIALLLLDEELGKRRPPEARP